jgi:hypothetical protein
LAQKQYTEYTEQNIRNNKKLKYTTTKNLTNLGSAVFASYTLAFALQLRKKHGNLSVRAAAVHHKQTVQYKNNEQYNTQKKTVTQSSTVSQNNTEH